MLPSMSSVKYILATKSSSLPVVLVDGWWKTLGDSFRTDGSRWSWGGGRHHFTDLLPRYSFLIPLLSSSFFFVAALYENEKATSYQTESLSLRHLLFSSAGYGMLPPLRALSGPFYLDAVFSPSPAASMHSRDSPWRGDTGANMI